MRVKKQNFNVDINTFSSMQSLAYNIAKDHFNNPDPQSPLHLIINGFAGTRQKLPYQCIKKPSAK